MNIFWVSPANRKWYQIVLWWELRRIPYNIVMYFVGLASFNIAYVSIPLIYLFIGLLLNVFYTFGWIVELSVQNSLSGKSRAKFPAIYFILYVVASAVLVFAIAIWLLAIL